MIQFEITGFLNFIMRRAIYAVSKQLKRIDESTKGFIIGKVLAIITKSSPISLRSTKICKVYDDALARDIRITDPLFLPLLEFCKSELLNKPFSIDVSILYHKIHKIYEHQKLKNEEALFGSSIMALILQICLLKKDTETFDSICVDLHHMEQYDDDLVANVKKLYGLELINLTANESSEISDDDFSKEEFQREILKRSIRESFLKQRANALQGQPTESEALSLLNEAINRTHLKLIFQKPLAMTKKR